MTSASMDTAYTSSGPATGHGHLLDLCVPEASQGPGPRSLVIWSHSSGWMADNGRIGAAAVAAQLGPRGFAVAGVAVRSGHVFGAGVGCGRRMRSGRVCGSGWALAHPEATRAHLLGSVWVS
jgi:hypothetical protein